jgi:hypothetical protein
MRRNPKSEIRNPKQIRISKAEMFKTIARTGVLNFQFSDFEFVADCGLRIADLGVRRTWT